MNKLLLSTLVVLAFLTFSVQAQSSRLRNLADQLQRNTDDLAERSYNEFTRGFSSNRTELNNLLVAQQLKATADVFRRLVNDNRDSSDLREVANALNDIAHRASSVNSSQWRDVRRDIDDIIREVGSGGSGNRDNDNRDRDERAVGRVNWQGTVDDEVHLVIRDSSLQIRTISGTQYNDGMFNFTSPLPNQRVTVQVNKKKGRGTAKVIQQPSRENNFTTIIQVLDKSGGAREYELDISWSR